MELWSQFLDLLTHNEYFRAGFIWGLGVVLLGWMVGRLVYWVYVQWLKIRQFFEPTKVPGKAPVANGPSPASLMFGCLGHTLVVVVVLMVLGVLLWWVNPIGS